MRGFVPTPAAVVDLMVGRLLADHDPARAASVLDPGCGEGAFLAGVRRWEKQRGAGRNLALLGVESEPRRAGATRAAFSGDVATQVVEEDYLRWDPGKEFDFIIGNPPYVPITALSEAEKRDFRGRFAAARGRFDLYLLFMEKSLRLLRPGGRMVFITPEKYLYVATAVPLRRILAQHNVEEIDLVGESTFEGLVTYPTITTIVRRAPTGPTRMRMRGGVSRDVVFGAEGAPIYPAGGATPTPTDCTLLADLCVRISAGVATGADSVFVHEARTVPEALARYAHPTAAGRELRVGDAEQSLPPANRFLMLVPYDEGGALRPLEELGPLAGFLNQDAVKSRLQRRTCVARKPWHAFHETPPLGDVLRPKLVCKDIGPTPRFWIDRTGTLLPRHTIYYLVPHESSWLKPLCDYLNGPVAAAWLAGNCQRAANGFIRMQSATLKKLPVPDEVVRSLHPPWAGALGGSAAPLESTKPTAAK